MSNKRTIKKRKIRLTPLGKKVAGLAGAIMIGTSLIGIMAVKESAKADVSTPPTIETIEEVETTESFEDIFVVNQESLTPIINETTATITTTPVVEETTPSENEEIETLVEEVTPTISVEQTNETIATETINQDNNEERIIEEDTSYLDNINSTTTLSVGYAYDRNASSDLENYNKVRNRFGPLIDHIATETRWDPRIITAFIAQENPDKRDQSANYTYGITSITTVHQGQTYSYGYFDENGNYSMRNITIDVYSLDNNELYMDGLYGNVTTGDYNAIIAKIAILENYANQINNSNSYLDSMGSFILAMPAYNSGVTCINNLARNNNNLNSTLNDLSSGSNPAADSNYISHVLYKIPEEFTNDLYFTTLSGQTYSFNLEQTNTLGGLSTSNNSRTL